MDNTHSDIFTFLREILKVYEALNARSERFTGPIDSKKNKDLAAINCIVLFESIKNLHIDDIYEINGFLKGGVSKWQK